MPPLLRAVRERAASLPPSPSDLLQPGPLSRSSRTKPSPWCERRATSACAGRGRRLFTQVSLICALPHLSGTCREVCAALHIGNPSCSSMKAPLSSRLDETVSLWSTACCGLARVRSPRGRIRAKPDVRLRSPAYFTYRFPVAALHSSGVRHAQ